MREKERTRAQRERERERDVNSSLKIINKKENEQKTRQAWWLKINKEYDRDSLLEKNVQEKEIWKKEKMEIYARMWEEKECYERKFTVVKVWEKEMYDKKKKRTYGRE